MSITPAKILVPLGSVTAAAAALLIAGMVASTPKPSEAAMSAGAIARMLEPQPRDVDRELRRVGIDPEALAASGVDAAATTSLANRALNHLGPARYSELRQAMEAHGQAKAKLDELQRAFRAGTPGDATRSDLDAAIAAEASTLVTLDARQADLYDAATEGLSREVLARLAAIEAQADLAYPEYFKVADRSHAQAIALRDALNGVRIDTKLGQEPSGHHRAVIDAQLADPSIAAAKATSEANLAAIRAAWDAAFRDR